MAEFPPNAIPPREFFEDWLPRAFEESDWPSLSSGVDVTLGVKLLGEDGGEWVFRIGEGTLEVRAEPRADAPLSVVQPVEHWRGALWEGRGGAFGRQAAALFRPGALQEGGAARASPLAPTPAALAALQRLEGLLRLRVTGEEAGDWHVDLKLGAGELPEEPTTTVEIAHDDAVALERGELDPVQAFLSGRIRVLGDMGLVLQLQAVQMEAASGGGGPA